MTKQRAFDQGVLAGFEGLCAQANPYDERQEEAMNAWNAGYQEAQIIRVEWEAEYLEGQTSHA